VDADDTFIDVVPQRGYEESTYEDNTFSLNTASKKGNLVFFIKRNVSTADLDLCYPMGQNIICYNKRKQSKTEYKTARIFQR